MSFTFRGVERIIGTIIQPNELEWLEMQAKGFFHHLMGGNDVVMGGPTPPAIVDYATAAQDGLATMLCNDRLGCCAVAEDLHLAAVRAGAAGGAYVPTDDECLTEYGIVAGYSPSDPRTDKGTNPLALLKWRRSNPYPDGSRLLDARAVIAQSLTCVQQAVWLAVGAYGWLCLPDACQSEENAGDLWDVCGPPNPKSGHAVGITSYTTTGGNVRFRLTTWGEEIDATPAFVATYMVPAAGGGLVALIDNRNTSVGVLDALTRETAS